MRPIALFLALILGGLGITVLGIVAIAPVCSLEQAPKQERQNSGVGKRSPDSNQHSPSHPTPSLYFAHAIENPTQTSHQTTPPNEGTGWWGKFFCDMKIGDAALVYFTYCLVVAGAFQAFYVLRTVQGAEQSMLILESAYVFAGIGGTQRGEIEPGRPVIVPHVSAVNYGRTPGFVSFISWDLCGADPEPAALPTHRSEYGHQIFVGWTLPPDMKAAEQHTAPATDPLDLPLAKPLLFHGLITYEDIFGREHYCGFAFRINADGSMQPVAGLDAYARHDKRRPPPSA
jgi:hypothetical protein